MKNILIFIIIIFSLTGCFDNLNANNKPTSNNNKASAITSAHFSGVVSATNRISGILVIWPAVTDPSLVKSYRIYRGNSGVQTLVGSLAPSLTSFMDGTVNPGSIYTYTVKAVDKNDIEDSNTKTVKALSWAGIDTVTANSRTSLVVNFKLTTPVADEIRVYGQTSIGGSKTLLATASGNDTSVELDGLRTGYNYIITAQAFVASLGKEDGNDLTFTASTFTRGYDTDGASLPGWANVMAIRAFGDAPAAPTHPITPSKSPSNRVVELAFLAFNGVSSSSKYVVTRAVDGFLLDSSVSTSCSNTTFTSCRVCDNITSASGVINCTDNDVAASPVRYRYAVSLIQTDPTTNDSWVEPLPTNQDVLAQFSVLVPIPPKNMVLVQRDAANYEMCSQLNKSPDPLNHNRCNYTGIGATTYSTGNGKPPLNLSPGYYDFGYDLFVDRWEMACNWTRATQGAMCGSNHSSGDCIGYGNTVGAPTASQGKVGDVYLFLNSTGGSQCYIASAQDPITQNITWSSPPSVLGLTNSDQLLSQMLTSDPGYKDASGNYQTSIPGKKIKISNNITPLTAASICSSMVDPDYGVKRLSRAREYVVYSAPPILLNEPYTYSSYSNFLPLMAGSSYHDSGHRYGCDVGGNMDALPSNLNQFLDYSNYPNFNEIGAINGTDSAGYTGVFGSKNYITFSIGAAATVDCQSRYGVQDMMRRTFLNDAMMYNATTHKLTGIQSPYDSGNRDFLADISGGNSGYVMDVSAYTQTSGGAYLAYNSALLTAFIPALALPIISSVYSPEYLPRALITQSYSFSVYAPVLSAATQVVSAQLENRWASHLMYSNTSNSAFQGTTRCVLPAE